MMWSHDTGHAADVYNIRDVYDLVIGGVSMWLWNEHWMLSLELIKCKLDSHTWLSG